MRVNLIAERWEDWYRGQVCMLNLKLNSQQLVILAQYKPDLTTHEPEDFIMHFGFCVFVFYLTNNIQYITKYSILW